MQPKPIIKQGKSLASADAGTRAMLYDGANLSQLGVLFRMDHRVLVEKLHGVAPCGTRNGSNIYQVHEVAPHLVKPIYEIEAYIKKMAHTELPKMLSKEFWAGQRSRQEYLLKEGNLWPTEKVIEYVGDLMKVFKMSTRLFSDAVDRQSELTDKQRKIIKNLSDGMLIELHQTVVDKFKSKKKETPDDDEL